MATAKQIAANRINSQNSPGPSSPEAKEKVSQNRTVHGLCGKFCVRPFESQERFDTLLDALTQAEKPADASELELVVKMAEHTWLARRALRAQDNCFTMEPRTPDQELAGVIPVGIDPRLERYVRYHAAQDRAYRRASQELMERRKQRQLVEIGIERQKQAAAEEERRQAQERRRQEDAERRQNEEIRRDERHKIATEIAKTRKQLVEIKAAKALA
ncbi:MAG TPA: hypothetical protein VH302_09545, partial [Bryobacteraceae bacterium]|nr:hypothetical protein [Bryobacteraceae bacterium]